MGGTSANRLTGALTGGLNGDVLGGTGGVESHTLTTAELAVHAHAAPALGNFIVGGDGKSRAFIQSTFRCNKTIVLFYDLFTNG